MSDTAIIVEGLGKRYQLGELASSGDVVRGARRFARRLVGRRDETPAADNSFWAVRDVSFEVKRGEVLGVIGRNGAGKSTLLKLLSRITAPTEGRIRVRGRVASLLEVGTGMHPELTGRENVYLNGSLLGMTKREIDAKFDEIVDFAGVEKFIDTPLKRYSSGMRVRLGFAVAAHLDPEILIVDEVLAVGDAEFQKKCFGKMNDVAADGRTVLLVSHNAAAVSRLCTRGLFLEQGTLRATGDVTTVLRSYLCSASGTTAERWWTSDAPGNAIARLQRVRICNENGATAEEVKTNIGFGIEMEFEVLESGYFLVPNFHVFAGDGTCVFVAQDISEEWRSRRRPRGRYICTAWVPPNLLAEGDLIIGAALSTFNPMKVHFFERDAVAVHVVEARDGRSTRGDYHGAIPGVVRPWLDWRTTYVPLNTATVFDDDSSIGQRTTC